METLLQGIPKIYVYLDDIFITEVKHLNNLHTVLSCLEQADMHLKKDKCVFLLSQVDYLRYQISQSSLYPTEEKVRAILNTLAFHNASRLKSFLGMLNYYSKFLSNLICQLF